MWQTVSLNFEIKIDVMRLYNGRRSFYAQIGIGRRHVFISRWDTARVQPKVHTFDIWRGPVMTWYAGTF